MKKILTISLIGATLLFSGCANSGLGLSGIGKNDVKQVFQKGTIETSQKVLVGKNKLTTLGYATGGAGVGAGVGAGISAMTGGDNTNGAIIGGVLGAGIGALTASLQEVEAYQVDIKDIKTGAINVAFLEKEVPLNSLVEYVVRDNNEVTNVNVTQIGSPKEIVVEKEKVIYKEKIIEKPIYKTKEVVKEKIVEKPVIKEVVKEDKKVTESPKKVETDTKKSIW